MSLVIWKGPTNALCFAPTTGSLTGGDRVRATDVYRGLILLCQNSVLARGTFGTGFRTGWVINQSYATCERGGIGTLTHEWEAGGAYATAPLPIGTYKLEKQELYPKIERNVYFDGITPQTVNFAQLSTLSSTDPSGNPIINSSSWLAGKIVAGQNGYDSTTAPVQLPLAQALATKLARGEETFYLVGWRYSYEVFSYTEPVTSGGGIIGTPGGPLSRLPSNMSWLRLADDMEPAGVAGSMFKLTVNWLGGPTYNGIGYWDPNLYPAY
jgi:hypothetical protein